MSRKTAQDPTGQAKERAKAAAKVQNRLIRAKRSIMEIFRAIPRTVKAVPAVQNAETMTVWQYMMTPQQEEAMLAQVRRELAKELEVEDETPPSDWFLKPDIEQAHRKGTAEETVEFNQLILLAIALGIVGRGGMPPQQAPVEAVLTSRPYRDDLSRAYAQGYASIKGMNETTSAQVIDRIRRGMRAGKSPTDIAADISERFDVAKSRAKTIADTTINGAYNDARLAAAKRAEEQTGLRAGVVHISALLPTTREEHAARHGKAYSPEQQEEWWNTGANRINCHCTTRTVLVDENGKVVEREER